MEETKMQRLCGKLTGHQLRKRYDIRHSGKRYCRCRICGFHFWEEVK